MDMEVEGGSVLVGELLQLFVDVKRIWETDCGPRVPHSQLDMWREV